MINLKNQMILPIFNDGLIPVGNFYNIFDNIVEKPIFI